LSWFAYENDPNKMQPHPLVCRLVTGARDRTLRVWNVLTGECVHVLRGHRDLVYTH
jgi:WD40 repeat protein